MRAAHVCSPQSTVDGCFVTINTWYSHVVVDPERSGYAVKCLSLGCSGKDPIAVSSLWWSVRVVDPKDLGML